MSLLALFHDPFLQMALFAAALASIASGIVGTFVVIKRISFIAGSISHSVLGGIGFSIWLNQKCGILWLDPTMGAFLSAMISSLLIGWIHLKYRQREDAVIAAIWSTGMAVGVIFLSLSPGGVPELMGILFGNILWTTPKDLALLGAFDLVLITTVWLYYRRFLALSFDEELSLLRGIPVQRLYLILLCLIGLSVVILMQTIGAILILALLVIPATMASLMTSTLFVMMILSALFSFALSSLGLSLSFFWESPPGATIALVSAFSYFSLLIFKKKKFYFPSR